MIVFEFFYDKMEVFGPKMGDMARYLEMEDEEDEEEEEEGEVSLFIVLFMSIRFCLPKCLSVMPSPSGACTHSLTSLGYQCLLPCQTAGEGGL